METSCKLLIKEIRGLDKETRAWEAFNGVDGDVKNMVASLGAVGLLQSPAIRDRHWQQVPLFPCIRFLPPPLSFNRVFPPPDKFFY